MTTSAFRSTRQWRRATLRGVRWTYHASPHNRGNVLILHGYRESHDSLELWIKYLCDQGFNVITCDLPGHGGSLCGSKQPGYFENVAQLESVAYALLLELWEREKVPTFLVGYSLGSFIELLLLIQRRGLREHLIKGVVSLCVPVDVKGTARVYFPGLGLFLWAASSALGERQIPSMFVQQRQLQGLWRPSTGSWCYRGPTFFRVAYLFYQYTRFLQKNIRLLDSTNIYAFQGTDDTTAGYKKAKQVLGSLSNTRFEDLPGAGHDILLDLVLMEKITVQSGEWMCALASRRTFF